MSFGFGFGLTLVQQGGGSGFEPPITGDTILYANFTRNAYYLKKLDGRTLMADFTNNTYFLKGGTA